MMHAYHKELETGGVAYLDIDTNLILSSEETRWDDPESLYFMPNDGTTNVIETTIDVLILAEHLIPLIIRLFLLIFGNKEQKAEARLHHKAAREIAKAQKRWKE